jgi:spermidine synthase
MTTLDVAADDDRASAGERLAQWTRVLCVLFFFSGFPALIYQLTWQRALFRIFGVNIESVTIVVTAFMLGLGLGSLAGGWLSKRSRMPLLPLLATIELLTGAFGLVSFAVFDQVGALTAGWPLPAMAAVNLALVIVPTLLMGATLPILVGHLVRRSGNVGSAVGTLYYVNTLGAVSLSYEIFFFRTVSYTSGSSATAFAATPSAFLVGLASGSRRAGHNCATLTREEARRRAVGNLMVANLLGLLFLPLISHLAWLDRGVVGVAMLMVYLVARFWGSLLPYLAELGVAADGQAGMRTALLYLANILGSILTGFMLMDHLSLIAIGAVLVVAGFLCVILLIAVIDMPRWQKLVRSGLAAVVAVFAAISIPSFAHGVLENLQWKGAADAKPFVDVVETRSGIITVDAEGTVFGHGMYDGRFNTDLKHDSNGIVRPFALNLFHPAPRHVLMIGLSSGSWAQVIANNPEVASLTVVEINPGYLDLVARAPEVASVLANRKVTVVTDDGRRWLRLNPDRRFDVIVSNTTWHFRANVTNLLSAEFLDLIRDRLGPGGVFFYNTTGADWVQRTGCLAFAHGGRFTNHMAVSAAPIAWDFARWRRTLEIYRIDGKAVFDLAKAGDRAVLDQLMAMEASLAPGAARDADSPIEPCPEILARTAGKRIVTDDNMGSEWRYFLALE